MLWRFSFDYANMRSMRLWYRCLGRSNSLDNPDLGFCSLESCVFRAGSNSVPRRSGGIPPSWIGTPVQLSRLRVLAFIVMCYASDAWIVNNHVYIAADNSRLFFLAFRVPCRRGGLLLVVCMACSSYPCRFRLALELT